MTNKSVCVFELYLKKMPAIEFLWESGELVPDAPPGVVEKADPATFIKRRTAEHPAHVQQL